jgi:hypothetical protein
MVAVRDAAALVGRNRYGWCTLRAHLLASLFLFLPLSNTVGRAYFYVVRFGAPLEEAPLSVLFGPAVLLPLLLFAVPGTRMPLGHIVSIGGFTPIWLLWFVAGSISTLANYETEWVLVHYLTGFLSALLVFVALRRHRWSSGEIDYALLALALGSMVPMVLGAHAYYQEFGVPDLQTLVFAPFRVERWEIYRELTFGNVQNTACFIVLLSPPLLALVLDRSRHWAVRGICAASVFLQSLNLLLIQARTGIVLFLVAIVIVAVIVYKRQVRNKVVALFALFVIGSLIIGYYSDSPSAGSNTDAIDVALERLDYAIRFDTGSDESAAGRAEAMTEGWNLFIKNWPGGLGPSASLLHHSRGSAHQFNLAQGMESGVLGFLASIFLVLQVLLRFGSSVVRSLASLENYREFLMLFGPALYLTYGVLSNVILNMTYCNVWICMLAALLALADNLPPSVIQPSPCPPTPSYTAEVA